MEQITLPEFVEFLLSRKKDDFANPNFDTYLRRYKVPLEEFNPYIFFREETYASNIVANNRFFELLVLTWLPRQHTPIHDHEGERCWTIMHSGKLAVKQYEPLNNGELAPTTYTTTLATGRPMFMFNPGFGIHAIENSTTKPAVSIHLNAAPVKRCRVFRGTTEKFDWAQLDHFDFPPEVISQIS